MVIIKVLWLIFLVILLPIVLFDHNDNTHKNDSEDLGTSFGVLCAQQPIRNPWEALSLSYAYFKEFLYKSPGTLFTTLSYVVNSLPVILTVATLLICAICAKSMMSPSSRIAPLNNTSINELALVGCLFTALIALGTLHLTSHFRPTTH